MLPVPETSGAGGDERQGSLGGENAAACRCSLHNGPLHATSVRLSRGAADCSESAPVNRPC